MGTEDILVSCLKAAERSMLSLGSGDGSQQLAIVKKGHTNIVTTFYDTEQQVITKFPHAKQIIHELRKLSPDHPPLFGVDATKLDKYNHLGRFDVIFFTFPHSGVSNDKTQESVASNRCWLREFLRTAPYRLKPGGQVQITLKIGEVYDRWGFADIVKESNFKYCTRQNLDKSLFPGYVHRLTIGIKGHLTKVRDKQGAMVYILVNQESTQGKKKGRQYVAPTKADETTSVYQTKPSESRVEQGKDSLGISILKFLKSQEITSAKKSLTVLEMRRIVFAEPCRMLDY